MTGLFERFLRALGDAEAGEALYRMQAAEALVRHCDRLQPAADVAVEAFERSHREVSLDGLDALPKYGAPKLLQARTDPATLETVAWFELGGSQTNQPIAAVGVQGDADALRIGWCTLSRSVEPWSYRDGFLHSLADYSWLRKTDHPAARALLDASYFRLHWRPPLKLTTLPDARFSCQMSTACCRHDFDITLPVEAQLVIDAMPWGTLQPELAGTRLPVRPDGKLQLKELNETCRFLGAHHQCLIHQTLGRQPFGPCAVFPFSFAQTPEGIAVSLSPICGSTRLGLGIAPLDREEDLRERLAHVDPRRPDGFRIAPGAEISWETFRDVENGLRECLAAEGIPMRRRLHVGAKLLGALRTNEPLDTNRWLDEPLAQITPELREAIHGMLGKILCWDRAALRTLPRAIPQDLARLEIHDPQIFARIVHNVLYSKIYSYPFDLTTAHNLSIVLYLLALVMQAGSNGALPDVMWRELGSLGVHGLLKNVLHDGVPEGFRNVLGTSDFGQWALAA